MWTIVSFISPSVTAAKIYACDGLPVLNTPREDGPETCRIMIGGLGFIDIKSTVTGTSESDLKVIQIQNVELHYTGAANLELSLLPNRRLLVKLGNEAAEVLLSAIPQMEGSNVDRFREMIKQKLVPYQNPPSGTPKSDADLQILAEKYFPGDSYGFDKAMCLYDWTSASFIRQDVFHQLQYTGVEGLPLDLETMARVIWGCNFPGYTPADPDFMNQFGMTPASSQEEIYNQLLEVQDRIKPLAIAEMNVQIQSLLSLPNPKVADYPQLYRGAMPMSGGYDTSDFSPSMFEYSGNKGPVSEPLIQLFDEALKGILKPGSVITTKGPWSFSNDLEGAKVWQNGILITCLPPKGAEVWPGCADITAFSLNPGTFEINVAPVTRYRIESYEWITIKDKPVCHFTMTMLGYSGSAISS